MRRVLNSNQRPTLRSRVRWSAVRRARQPLSRASCLGLSDVARGDEGGDGVGGEEEGEIADVELLGAGELLDVATDDEGVVVPVDEDA